jgi:membrane-bound serine protease (ClpP class)
MRTVRRAVLFCLSSGVLVLLAFAAPLFAGERTVYFLHVEGTIGVSMENHVVSRLKEAADSGTSLVVLELDTPGGLVSSLRAIVSAILESPVPVVVWVAPEGARAASAGAFLLQAAHVAAMAPGTNVGAAHPVTAGGKDVPDKEMNRKVLNDLSAYMRSLAQMRGRNPAAAERMVTESRSLTTEEAMREGLLDVVASDRQDLLSALRGRTVSVRGKEQVLDISSPEIVERGMTLRERLLQFLSSPDIAYLFLMAGVLAIFLEIMSPGGFVLGTSGAVLVLLGAFGLRVLPFNWAGILLLLVGVGVMLLDILVGGVGVLSLFGLAAIVTGGLVVFRAPGGELLRVPLDLIVGMSVGMGVFFLLVVFLVVRSLKRKPESGMEGMTGETAVVVEPLDPSGLVKCRGELWVAEVGEGIRVEAGRMVRIERFRGMTLLVIPEENKGGGKE